MMSLKISDSRNIAGTGLWTGTMYVSLVFNTCHGSNCPLFSWFSRSLILPRTPQEKPSNRGTKQTLWVLDLESLSCRCHIFLLQVVFGENTCTIKVPINGYFPSVIKVNIKQTCVQTKFCSNLVRFFSSDRLWRKNRQPIVSLCHGLGKI